MIVGRNLETQELLTALHSSRPEFVVVYGRRRVGKTYLIDTVYRDYIAFRHAGLPPMKGTPKKETAATTIRFCDEPSPLRRGRSLLRV